MQEFSAPPEKSAQGYDIAVLKVDSPFEINHINVDTAELPATDHDVSLDQIQSVDEYGNPTSHAANMLHRTLHTVGWGRTDGSPENKYSVSPHLKHVRKEFLWYIT